ncbi:hypothetical protein BIV59_04165 [Bacillus sp. MUM 13]|nr:hypothetical protein BIV59_04165 [Bacillus sp. MUM 13]
MSLLFFDFQKNGILKIGNKNGKREYNRHASAVKSRSPNLAGGQLNGSLRAIFIQVYCRR